MICDICDICEKVARENDGQMTVLNFEHCDCCDRKCCLDCIDVQVDRASVCKICKNGSDVYLDGIKEQK